MQTGCVLPHDCGFNIKVKYQKKLEAVKVTTCRSRCDAMPLKLFLFVDAPGVDDSRSLEMHNKARV